MSQSINRNNAGAADSGALSGTGQGITGLIENDLLTTHFQPIFGSNKTVYGYEALARVKADLSYGIGEVFQTAKNTGTISHLDMYCRNKAVTRAAALGLKETNAFMFVNICPETLMDSAFKFSLTNELLGKSGLPKNRMVLEITEESAVNNVELFKKNVDCYRELGYRIAIDDFGAGYGGLMMLSILEPDYVKIDRHFISLIDKSMVKYVLVDSISTACHRLGIKVIAEGIERDEEFKTLINMGIEMFQGFYLQKPSPVLDIEEACPILSVPSFVAPRYEMTGCIGNIAKDIEPILPSADFMDGFFRFIRNSKLHGLPVVEDNRIVGMLHRNRFLENRVLGNFGYGFALNAYKTVGQMMDTQFIMAEADTNFEELARRVQIRAAEFIYDDICVTKNGKYYGILAISDLLNAITERSIIIAKGSNPLTGLPGNEFIEREINKKLLQHTQFDVCYVDIDNFKPYNDSYGFQKGDNVIKSLGAILDKRIRDEGDDFNFIGHIGGDDFIMVVHPQRSVPICEKVISEFEAGLIELHGKEDFTRGYYTSKNRKGDDCMFPLLSISIGIVSSKVHKFEVYAELASTATEVKNAAKMKCGSAIVKDRRTK